MKKKVNISKLSLVERQQGFLDEYRVLSIKWGVDLQPVYQVLDVFAAKEIKEAQEALKVTEEEKNEKPEISKE